MSASPIEGRRRGRPRNDDAIMAVLSADTWTLARAVAERLNKPLGSTCVALWRVQRRGLIERRWGRGGYRLKRSG